MCWQRFEPDNAGQSSIGSSDCVRHAFLGQEQQYARLVLNLGIVMVPGKPKDQQVCQASSMWLNHSACQLARQHCCWQDANQHGSACVDHKHSPESSKVHGVALRAEVGVCQVVAFVPANPFGATAVQQCTQRQRGSPWPIGRVCPGLLLLPAVLQVQLIAQ